MHKERRNRIIDAQYYIDEQVQQWNWDSHLWVNARQDANVYMCCEWCGWTPPAEFPLENVKLCKNNPSINKLLKQLGSKITEAFKLSFLST